MSNVSSSNNQEVNVPRLRFPGFEGEWNEHTLGELGNFIKGAPLSKADISEEGAPFILYGELYTTYNEVIDFVLRKTNRQVSPEHISKIGDVIIPTSGETPEEIATASCVMQSGVILAGDLNIYRTSLVDGRLISYIIRHVVNRHISSVAQGKSVVHVKADELAKIYIRYPEKNEQLKILNFLALIQKRINHQKKFIDTLKLYKRGALSRLFPKNGSRVPEYRFSGFTGDWEQRKLGEVADYRNGKAHENNIDDDGEYIVVNSKFVSTNGEVKKFTNIQNEPLYENEIAFVLSDVPNGRAIARTFWVEKSGKYTLNQRIAGITPHKDTDSYYLYTKMNRNTYFLKFDDGNKQTNLSVQDVLSYEDKYPTYEEQQKIGTYFRSLDHLITLHQKKAEQYINLKQSLLEKLFI